MPPHEYIRTRGVRWSKEQECFTMWCPGCAAKGNTATFWPLTPEFWDVNAGLSRCRACTLELKRIKEAGRRATKREELIEKNRAYYSENRETLRWKDNQRKAQRRAATRESAPA